MPRRVIATRERILSAAETRFSNYGFKRTSMHDIADEAHISRAALYLQFRNKEEIFRSLSQALLNDALRRASLASQGRKSLAEELTAAAEGMSFRFLRSVYASPHGGELLDEKNRLCGDQAAAAIQRYREILARLFRRASQRAEIDLISPGLNPSAAAELYHRATFGLLGPGVTAEMYQKSLRVLTKLFVAGLGRSTSAGTRRPRAAGVRQRPSVIGRPLRGSEVDAPRTVDGE
jgi:AcrR family transcriptional regulator